MQLNHIFADAQYGQSQSELLCINWNPPFKTQIYLVKFRLSEKDRKFEKKIFHLKFDVAQ